MSSSQDAPVWGDSLYVLRHCSNAEFRTNGAPALTDEASEALQYQKARSIVRLGTWCAEGANPARIQASPETLRLLGIDVDHSEGTSLTLLRCVRFEELARLHRDATCRGGRQRIIKREIRIVLRDGTQRLLLARVVSPVDGDDERSMGMLVDVTVASSVRGQDRGFPAF